MKNCLCGRKRRPAYSAGHWCKWLPVPRTAELRLNFGCALSPTDVSIIHHCSFSIVRYLYNVLYHRWNNFSDNSSLEIWSRTCSLHLLDAATLFLIIGFCQVQRLYCVKFCLNLWTTVTPLLDCIQLNYRRASSHLLMTDFKMLNKLK